MDIISLLIYMLFFILGSVIGLKTSYNWHGEIYVIQKIDIIALIMSVIGWVVKINYKILPANYLTILIAIALFLIGFVLEMRPGYGRKETIIGVLIGILIWILRYIQIL